MVILESPFDDEEIVYEVPSISRLELDHLSDGLHIVKPGILLRFGLECGRALVVAAQFRLDFENFDVQSRGLQLGDRSLPFIGASHSGNALHIVPDARVRKGILRRIERDVDRLQTR